MNALVTIQQALEQPAEDQYVRLEIPKANEASMYCLRSKSDIEPSNLPYCQFDIKGDEERVELACRAINILYKASTASNFQMHYDSGSHNDYGCYFPAETAEAAKAIGIALNEFEKSIKQRRILDLGSGDGRVAVLASLAFSLRVDGYELDRQLHRFAQALITSNNLEGIRLHNSNFLQSPFKDFDLLFYYDGGSLNTRYAEDYLREDVVQFLEGLSQMQIGAKLIVLHSQRVHNLLEELPFLSAPTYVDHETSRFRSRIYTRNNFKMPEDIREIFEKSNSSPNGISSVVKQKYFNDS